MYVFSLLSTFPTHYIFYNKIAPDRVMPPILYWDIEVEGGLVFILNISYICALLVSDEFHFHFFFC